MKVLHVCSYYIGSKLYSNMVSNLDELGIENEVYIPISSEELINKNCVEGLSKTNFIYSKAFNTIDRFNFKLKTNKIYQDLLNKVNLDTIDIVHAHSLFVNGYLAYRLKKEKNIDYIVAIRNTDVNVFFKKLPWLRNIGIEIMKKAKNIIFISNPYKDEVIKKYVPDEYRRDIIEKSLVIPNGVDNFWLENINKIKRKSDNKVRLIYVGSLDRNKNIECTIKAIDKLISDGYDIEFNIVGNGSYENKIKKIVSKNRQYIKMHGYLNKEEIIKIYRNSDIFIMPSKKETFGLVYVEALTQGLPVIYTRNQGFDGYFEDNEVGKSVNCNNYMDIKEKIEYIIDNGIDVCKYQERVKLEFNWYNIVKKYIRLYNNN